VALLEKQLATFEKSLIPKPKTISELFIDIQNTKNELKRAIETAQQYLNTDSPCFSTWAHLNKQVILAEKILKIATDTFNVRVSLIMSSM